ncbi:MAG: flavodoxin family protein [Coriobacteriales bacterium]|jgi:multimeric flavodoxin WrbA|nr:flavodoxin family protein [Coriobacteriales bacterium]
MTSFSELKTSTNFNFGNNMSSDVDNGASHSTSVYGFGHEFSPNILLICGSPRSHASEYLLNLIAKGAEEAGAQTKRFCLSQKHVNPCNGCNACSKTGICVLASEHNSTYNSTHNNKHNSTHNSKLMDDYPELLRLMEQADALALVAPLYFAGPSAQLKALLDRMQPYWAKHYVLGVPPRIKRPAQLFITGGGGDKHGYDPLVTITKSALAVAGFGIEKVHNFVGFKLPDDILQLPDIKVSILHEAAAQIETSQVISSQQKKSHEAVSQAQVSQVNAPHDAAVRTAASQATVSQATASQVAVSQATAQAASHAAVSQATAQAASHAATSQATASININELAHMRKEAQSQMAFEQRAIASGGAVARFAYRWKLAAATANTAAATAASTATNAAINADTNATANNGDSSNATQTANKGANNKGANA